MMISVQKEIPMEDFNEISTVQDLLKFNEVDEIEVKYNMKSEELLKVIYKEDPQVGLRIVRNVLESLENFHLDVSKQLSDKSPEGQEMGRVWMIDASKLRCAIETIEDIAM